MPDITRAIETVFPQCFKDLSTWGNWFTILKGLFGLPMDRRERRFFKKIARRKPPQKPIKRFYCIAGRRSGKSFVSALIGVFLGLFFDYRKYLGPGERGVIQVIAVDRAQARVIFSYISGILHSSDVLGQYILSETKERLELSTEIDIEIATSSFKSIRGRTTVATIADEIAFFETATEVQNTDREIINAVIPSMATIPNSILICLSSPYAKRGVLYEAYESYFGKDNPDCLVIQAESVLLNPTLDVKWIKDELKRDPLASRAEWLAEFRDDLETAFDPEKIDACRVHGRTHIPHQPGRYYHCFVDPSGGRADSFTLAIGHNHNDKVIVDCLEAWEAPFDPDVVVGEAVQVLNSYGIHRVVGDKYGGAWVPSAFEKMGISYVPCDLVKSDLYLNFQATLNSEKIELPDDPVLIEELKRLERRRGRLGRDKVDHPPRFSDDRANSIVGLVHVLRGEPDMQGTFEFHVAPRDVRGLSDVSLGLGDSTGNFWDQLEAEARFRERWGNSPWD